LLAEQIAALVVARDQLTAQALCEGRPADPVHMSALSASILRAKSWRGAADERRHLAAIGRHSEKPDAFYALVEGLCPAPRYCELFSRRRYSDKWDCHGDEAPPDHLSIPMSRKLLMETETYEHSN
jgi:hypothetical protein